MCSIDLEGHLGASAVLLEDLIDRHQQHALPTPDHPRHGGLHVGCSGEVEFSTIQGIDAGELDACAGNIVVQIG